MVSGELALHKLRQSLVGERCVLNEDDKVHALN